MRDTAIEMAKRLLADSIWKSANLEGVGTIFPKTEVILSNTPTTTRTQTIDKTEEFKTLLIKFYEIGDDIEITEYMLEYCIKRIRSSEN